MILLIIRLGKYNMNIPFEILIDTREKKPFFYNRINNTKFPELKIKFKNLKTGDYSIKGYSDPAIHQHSITIERKEISDLFGSTGRGRVRLEKEFIRMADFDYAALIIEADFKTIFKSPPELSMMKPKSVFRTIIAFCQRYNVQCFPCPDRSFAEQTTYILLKRFFDDRQKGGKMEFCKI